METMVKAASMNEITQRVKTKTGLRIISFDLVSGEKPGKETLEKYPENLNQNLGTN